MTEKNEMSNHEKQMKAYWHILKNRNGDQEDLLEICSESLDDFASSGFIAFGMDSSATPRFKTTEFGEDYAREVYIAMSSNLAHDDLNDLLSE